MPVILGAAVALLWAWLGAAPAQADFYLHGWTNQYQRRAQYFLEPEFGFYNTRQNFDSTGALTQPANFSGYTRIQGDVTFGVGLSSRVSAFARLAWARAQLEHTTLAGESLGLTDQSVGITARIWENKLPKGEGASVDLQVQGDLPAYSNSNAIASGAPFLGDGSMDLTGGLFVNLPLSAASRSDIWMATAGAGYTYRSDSFSAAIPWSVALAFRPQGKGFAYSFGVRGLASLKSDPRGSVANPASAGLGAGGSFIANAVNPSLLAGQARIGYQADRKLGVFLSGLLPVTGLNAPQGLLLGIGFTARWGSYDGKSATALTPQEYGRSNQGVISYFGEARVLRSNDRLNLVKIDKGSQDGVEVGQIFDIFLVKQDGSEGEAVARTKVSGVKQHEAALTVVEYFKEVWIEEGFVAKRPLE